LINVVTWSRVVDKVFAADLLVCALLVYGLLVGGLLPLKRKSLLVACEYWLPIAGPADEWYLASGIHYQSRAHLARDW
jgi:hypothetical protein